MVEKWRKSAELALLLTVCILICNPICISGATDPNDASALRVMYSSLNSPGQLTQWSSSGDDPCGQSWKGVTCSGQRVTEIKLSGLGLSGSLGYQLTSLTSLTNLDMSNNKLGGTIPYNLPPNLERLDFANNQFTGDVPYSISQMKSLKYLNIAHNQLQNQLSDMFGQLLSLSTLELSFNSLPGDLPESFSSLSSLTTMYLQNNQFTGTIDVLANLPLENLNIANNHFTGWIPEQLKNVNLQKDGNTWSTGPAPPPPPGTPPASSNKPKHKSGGDNTPSDGGFGGNKKSGIGGGGIAGIIISLLLVGAIVAFFLFKRRSRRTSSDIEKHDNQPFAPLASNEVQEMKSIQTSSAVKTKTFDTSASINLRPPPIDRHKSFDEDDYPKKPIVVKKAVSAPVNVPSYSIADLQMATGSFSVENLLGEGSFGRVYRARFDDGKVLAVIKIDSSTLPSELSEDFMEIVSNISHLHHPNVTELVGYCSEHGLHLLLYEFHKSGSLHEFLHLSDEDSRPLIWNSRVKIALGTARALEYLHEVCSPSIVHKNIKSANILLDSELNPHLSDSGLASFFPNADQALNHNEGSGCSAPEVSMSGQYTLKSDVYSFGVVMLELLTGRKPFDS
ncbi:LRR_1 domain-containing protein/Pkinase_Tyr domain-containing protein/LRRNT_2 domain-containing protein/LRR_4 domain-containing protein/LRR_6 domain-containing protein [Cephalotus follicularis]|uniref:LRR_1 domain-containing protein/Pkinase_Tyr domain-containing protein/LRRNT_2 domain-containing protein/LRR_4 domain-containing protein/LRR_6 domain-containing protein n=1 Tax=Cephalotus follicularis TaxID=3775 RepID=A0A1Q3D4H7_CEPFO|nr:LRR_1 domain-containing protein/Pkinase_Tyr domain-containing protein/LRRNT_2 domain-containing protein/LRR_4 domain-containing protein/LRR_6 domain-containing protein [Cephalotus follicularis]